MSVSLPAPNVAELTDREHEIAMLVARQLSNKEIAQRLFLSVRTVESHVYTARGKLGARSRRELGRLVSGGDGPGAGPGGQAGRER
ncbi:response regulator transcription factor [Herbiconiux sp. P16]|uniref:response regulator transcription factor n=1 Tax=Herbiconiux wuyangfengii TaxID=3342794 RepID=UPI0035BA3E0E